MKLQEIKLVCLVLRPRQQKARDLAEEVIAWLKKQNITSYIARQNEFGEPEWDCNALPDLVLVLGGDGTMLGALRSTIGRSIPVIGINLGQVGFLASISESLWQSELKTILTKGLLLQICAALEWKVVRGGQAVKEGKCINDVVIRGAKLAKLINVNISIDEEDVGPLRSDGLVISTPTGSSGYSFSAGGPLVQPNVRAIVVAPICAFLNRMPPLIVNLSSTITINVAENNPELFITSDGQEGSSLLPEDKVVIANSKEASLVGLLPSASHYAVLKDRGFIKR